MALALKLENRQAYQRLEYPSWRALPREDADRIGLSPNRAWYCGRHVVVVCKKNANSDGYSISEPGVDYFRDALLANRIATCTIRLVGGLGDVVGEQSLGEVWAKLKAAPVNVGHYSTYWWLDSDFNVSPIGRLTPDWLV
jgi:hypothetical protein